MDSFLGNPDSATVISKDLTDMPKEQFANADLFSDHSRFPIMTEEKSDISQKFVAAEANLLGDSFSMPPIAPALIDNKLLTQGQNNLDDFFTGKEINKSSEPGPASVSNLMDMGGLDFLEPQKKSQNNDKIEKPQHTESVPFGAGPGESLHLMQDEIASDYMNPYAEVRASAADHNKPKIDEPFGMSAASVEKEDIFSAFDSHKKEDHFAPEPKPTKPLPAAVPEPTPVVTPVPAAPSKVVPPAKQPEQKPIQPQAEALPTRQQSVAGEECIQAEKIFKQFGLVESLIYWRDVKKSGIVFGSGLTILIAMSLFSLISVFSYVSLLVLFGTVAFRIYKNVLQAVQKTSEGHPFKEYLDFDLTLSQEKVQHLTTVAVAHANALLSELRRLFLVEDLVDSIKFGVVLYCLTYVGAIFNGMTCVIIAFVALFTLPKVYENNKQSIDAYLELVRSKILEITEKVKAAVPLGKKAETDKEK
ncbi:reticulon-1 isoform X2 [Wyeomyia smithii]|uniref:reticulon-1 isoform X2 n=1 Tax=Wyeomyia smithii TaxID=174621 RepID=UPI002467CF0E|nr:reticulon-1 isoform X2 [Wyeomyia smithii]